MFNKYILPLLILFVIGATGATITLFKLSPCLNHDATNFCGSYSTSSLILMSLSIVIGLTGLLSIAGYLIRWRLYHKEVFGDHFNIALRQGFLLSLAVLGALSLLVIGIFRWWSVALLVALVVLVEFYFSDRPTHKPNHRP